MGLGNRIKYMVAYPFINLGLEAVIGAVVGVVAVFAKHYGADAYITERTPIDLTNCGDFVAFLRGGFAGTVAAASVAAFGGLVDGNTIARERKANKLFREGGNLLDAGEYAEAIDKYDEVINLTSGEWTGAFYNRGSCYFELGNPEKALVDFERYLKENPRDEGAVSMKLKSEARIKQLPPKRTLRDQTRTILQRATPPHLPGYDSPTPSYESPASSDSGGGYVPDAGTASDGGSDGGVADSGGDAGGDAGGDSGGSGDGSSSDE